MTVKTGTAAKTARTQRARKGAAAPAAAKIAARAVSKKAPASPAPVEAKPGKADKAAKTDKPKKVRMVRDSFTMPENDYAQIAELKKRCLQAGVHVKKSELLRAGLAYLSRLQKTALLNVVGQVERIKTGRPAKS